MTHRDHPHHRSSLSGAALLLGIIFCAAPQALRGQDAATPTPKPYPTPTPTVTPPPEWMAAGLLSAAADPPINKSRALAFEKMARIRFSGGWAAASAELALARSAAWYEVGSYLSNMGRESAASLDQIAAALNDANPRVRRGAITAIARLGCATTAHALKIVPFAKDPDTAIRTTALKTLRTLLEEARHGGTAIDVVAVAEALFEVHDADARVEGVVFLASADNADRKWSEKLIEIFKTWGSNVSSRAEQALVTLSQSDCRFCEELAADLSAPDPSEVKDSFNALSRVGKAARGYADRIADCLGNPETRKEALWALIELEAGPGKHAEQVVQWLGEPGAPDMKEWEMEVLILEDGGTGKYAGTIAGRLKDPDEKVRIGAMRNLVRLGEPGWAHAGEVAGMLKDPSPLIRGSAMETLSWMGSSGQQFADLIGEILNAPDSHDDWARKVLENMGEPGMRILSKLFRDPDPKRRLRAVANNHDAPGHSGVGRGFADELQFAEVVAEGLDAPQPEVRIASIRALPKVAVESPKLAEQLADRLDDSDPLVRRAAVEKFGWLSFDPIKRWEQIAERVKDPDPAMRAAAVRAMNSMSMQARQGAPDSKNGAPEPDYGQRTRQHFEETLTDPNPETRALARSLLNEMSKCRGRQKANSEGGADNEEAREQARQRLAVIADSEMGDPKRAARRIATALRDPDETVRVMTIDMMKWGIEDREVALQIASALDDSSPHVRKASIEALGRLGAGAAEFGPRISKLLLQDHLKKLVYHHPIEDWAGWLEMDGFLTLLENSLQFDMAGRLKGKTSTNGAQRYVAHLAAGADPFRHDLVLWLGGPIEFPTDYKEHGPCVRYLTALKAAWEPGLTYDMLHREMAERILLLATEGGWGAEDASLLEAHAGNLNKEFPAQAAKIRELIGKRKGIL